MLCFRILWHECPRPWKCILSALQITFCNRTSNILDVMHIILFRAEEQDKLHEAATSAQAAAAKKARKRRPGNCQTCGKPMLGHKSRQCKPKE